MKQRIQWVDNTKIFACILVVLGHFFQSMTASGILPPNGVYWWFNQSIYLFHVPLFFICSGFLYQRFSKVSCIGEWRCNVEKKMLTLGIPYLFFSVVTWILKSGFAKEVNTPVGGLFWTLFVNPMSPYWYLYSLLFCFLLIPTIQSRKMAVVLLVVGMAAKTATILGFTDVYGVVIVCSNVIWFVLGMLLAFLKKRIPVKKCAVVGAAGSVLFLVCSVVTVELELRNDWLMFLLGVVACTAVIMLLYAADKSLSGVDVLRKAADYTMPVFLMHTLCAAPIRQLLLKLGISNAGLHIFAGIVSSFAGPVLIAIFMHWTKYPEFVMYPGKFVNMRSEKLDAGHPQNGD